MATLLELRTEIRDRTDQNDSDFITDVELDSMINSSMKELYDLLVNSNEDYYLNDPVPFTITQGNSSFDLPTDFYKLRGVDVSISGEFIDINPYNFKERNRSNTRFVAFLNHGAQIQYRLRRGKLTFIPEERAAQSYQLHYIPVATELVADTDSFDGINGWEEYIIVDVASKIKEKGEEDASILLAQKQQLLKRIESMTERDSGSPERITDVRRNTFGFEEF